MTTEVQFKAPEEWVMDAREIIKNIEFINKTAVDLSAKARQLITWTEMVIEGIEGYNKNKPSFEIVTKDKADPTD